MTLSKQAITRRRNEAKRRAAAAQNPRGRLLNDGAAHQGQMRRRLLWLANQRGIPVADVPKVGRVCTKELRDFCVKHGITFEWLFEGDLKALLWMTQQRHRRAVAVTPESLKEKLARLSESEREVIRRMVDELVGRS
jgi:hypothetical protein